MPPLEKLLPPKGNPFGNPAKGLFIHIIEFESASLSTVLIIRLKQENQISNLMKSHFFGVSKGAEPLLRERISKGRHRASP